MPRSCGGFWTMMRDADHVREECGVFGVFSRERADLAPGEEASLAFFDSALPPDWEIYVRPHLNGLAPGFVLLSPAGGIAVVEVRGWTDAFLAQCRDDALLREPFARLRLAKEEIFEIIKGLRICSDEARPLKK